MTLPADEMVLCSECGGRLGLLTIVKGYTRLGHLSAPPTLHVPTPRAAAEAGVLGDIGGTRPQRERPDMGVRTLKAGLSSDPALPRKPRRARRVHAGSPVLNRGARPLNPPSGVVAGGGNHRAPRLSAGPRS